MITHNCYADHIANNDKKLPTLPIKATKEYRQPSYDTSIPLHGWLSYAMPQLNSFIITKNQKNETIPNIELSSDIKNGKSEIKAMVITLNISEGSWEISSLLNMDIYRY